MNTIASNFHWKCRHTWNRSAKNTLWCLMGCAIGDMGTILIFSDYRNTMADLSHNVPCDNQWSTY
jgi:hypothetical protein